MVDVREPMTAGVRIPTAGGETQPDNVFPKWRDFIYRASLMLIKTSRELRTARGSVDGYLQVKKIISSDDPEITPIKIVKTVAVAGTAEKLIAAATYAYKLTIQAKLVAAENTGSVFIGLSDLDAGVAELFELTDRQKKTIEVPIGYKFDVSKIYIDADTSDDGIVGWYWPVA